MRKLAPQSRHQFVVPEETFASRNVAGRFECEMDGIFPFAAGIARDEYLLWICLDQSSPVRLDRRWCSKRFMAQTFVWPWRGNATPVCDRAKYPKVLLRAGLRRTGGGEKGFTRIAFHSRQPPRLLKPTLWPGREKSRVERAGIELE